MTHSTSRSTSRDRQHLEHLWHIPPTSHNAEKATARINRWLKLAGKSLVDLLTNSQQLRVWTKDTRTGTLWFAYDPTTGQTISQTSEEGLRAWLEQRHYQ
ncbi:hypothetical protein S7335_2102 [Synechococcus sp. PCC 7335]|uniref:hypothetical protein n=1 Tax=Synechococcus sp. (strain ATCC 29403 / PCC 7335) TaxID=91464 RepID=UPI00017ECE95|nr:hypothetical protein [Synechococcus sp. PCC 7335]EDX84405.1 hypothetical protein S7335_2102 [Synechococcus sp. PCC 7335]